MSVQLEFPPLLKLEQLSLSFEDRVVLRDFSLSILKGEMLCLRGPSGVGKTSLLKILAGILMPSAGRVQNRAERVGFAFQEPRPIPWLSVEENLRLVFESTFEGQWNERGESILEQFALLSFRAQTPEEISGGTRQRLNLARAFMLNPELLLLDEPFASLDILFAEKLCEIMREQVASSGATLIFSEHLTSFAELLGARIFELSF